MLPNHGAENWHAFGIFPKMGGSVAVFWATAVRGSRRFEEVSVMSERQDEEDGPVEIAIVGDLTDSEADLTDRLLGVEPGGECTIYFDSPGGSPYCAVSLMTLIKMRKLRATGIVTGECSSATLWPFAACERRIVTPFSVMLFHPMRWQSEENVGLAEASEWARHFAQLEQDMDTLLAKLFGVPADMMRKWIIPGRYVSGREMAEAGMAELIELDQLHKIAFGRDQAQNKAAAPSGNGATASVRRPAKSLAQRKRRRS
jgi:ATP-dependent Clp protease protease subunit